MQASGPTTAAVVVLLTADSDLQLVQAAIFICGTLSLKLVISKVLNTSDDVSRVLHLKSIISDPPPVHVQRSYFFLLFPTFSYFFPLFYSLSYFSYFSNVVFLRVAKTAQISKRRFE